MPADDIGSTQWTPPQTQHEATTLARRDLLHAGGEERDGQCSLLGRSRETESKNGLQSGVGGCGGHPTK